jgi:hypothetical protein
MMDLGRPGEIEMKHKRALVVEELEKRLLPSLRKVADQITQQFPTVKATVLYHLVHVSETGRPVIGM